MKGMLMVKKTTRRGARAAGAVAVLAMMAWGSVPAMAAPAAPQSGGEATVSESDGATVEGSVVEEFGAEESLVGSDGVLEVGEAQQGSILGQLVERTSAQSEETAEEFVGEVYDDPGHADVDTFIDEETGEEYVLRSGVTHWEESDPDAPPVMQMALAPYSDVFKVTAPGMVPGGTIGSSAGLSRLNIEIDVPSSAMAGDQYTLALKSPFFFDTHAVQNREIKDSSGKVFAVTSGADPWDMEVAQGVPPYGKMVITFTDEVEAHTAIQGFIEVSFWAATASTTQNLTLNVFAPDGASLGPNLPLVRGASVAGNGFSYPNGAVLDNRPAINPAVNVAHEDIVYPFTFRVEPQSSGLTYRGCDKAGVYYQGFNSQGLWGSKLVAVPNLVCSVAENGTVTITLPTPVTPPAGFSDGQFRIESGGFYADQPSKSYDIRLTTSMPSSASPTLAAGWSGPIVSGVPVGAGADHLSLTTKKSASFTTQNGDAKPTVGDTITYTITTTPAKTNDRAIKNLVTLDRLPEGLEFVSATNGGEYNSTSREIVWGPRTLTSTGTFTDTVEAKITAVPASGDITNTVENVGEEVCTEDDTVSVCDSTVITPVGKPGFSFTKSSTLEDTNGNGWLGDKGDTIVYTFTVKNTGETTLTTAKLTDDLLGIKDVECLAEGTSVKPGASATCEGTFTHVISEADVEAGQVTNHATLCVDPAYGLACEPGETTEKVIDPSFSFEKHSEVVIQDGEDRGFEGAIAGDKIDYWFTVSNTGNVALKDVTIDDDLLGLKGAKCVDALPVGAKDVKCETTSSYTITEADQTAGEVLNAALGKVPGLPDEPGEVIDPTVDPAFEFDKSVVEIKDASGKVVTTGKASEGDVIHFGFSAKNTGNVDITSLLVSDPMLGVEDIQCLPDGFVLEVGKSVDCVDNAGYFYTVTAADVKAGKVHNIATGQVPGLPEQPGETTTPVLPNPVVTELPKTGAGGTWLIVGAGSLMLLGGAYALIRSRRKVGDSQEMAA